MDNTIKKKQEPIHDLPNAFHEILTESQAKAVERISEFFISDDNCFILKGYAGTGKTFLMKGLADYLDSNDITFFIMAPTGRAAQVASLKTGYRAYTIHKTIYLIDGGKQYKTTSGSEPNKLRYFFDIKINKTFGAVYIIDEASMISDTYSEGDIFRFGSGFLLKDLIQFVNINFNKIIFIGDPAQLPPVNSIISPALSKEYLENNYFVITREFELTDVVRQVEESGILENATKIRNSIRNNRFESFNISIGYNDMKIIEINEFLSEYLKASNGEIDYETIVLAYTNRKVKYYNELVRKHFFPGEKKITAGDRVMLVHNNYNYRIDLLNGEMGEVVWADENPEIKEIPLNKSEGPVNVKLSFRDMIIRFWDIEGKAHELTCKIFDSLLNSPERDIDPDESKALFFDLKMRYPYFLADSPEMMSIVQTDPYYNCLRVKYGYAITCHKAQGGEWDNVFIDFKIPASIPDKSYFRWAYTALTRSKNKVFILNPPDYCVDTGVQGYTYEKNKSHSAIIKVKANRNDIVLPPDFPRESEILKYIYFIVKDTIAGEKAAIERIIHFPFCERYIFSIDNHSVWINFWYDKNNKIILIDSQPDADAAAKSRLFGLFSRYSGKTIIPGDNEEHSFAN